MGTFVYGDSYYGLRAFDSTNGTVEDASAIVTASATIPNVNWAVAVGSGAISVSASSSATASGESVIIERTDEFSYGMGLYGYNEYTQGDLQIEITATSTTSCQARRVPEGSALGNGQCTTSVDSTTNGTRIRFGSASVSASASVTSSGQKVAKEVQQYHLVQQQQQRTRNIPTNCISIIYCYKHSKW